MCESQFTPVFFHTLKIVENNNHRDMGIFYLLFCILAHQFQPLNNFFWIECVNKAESRGSKEEQKKSHTAILKTEKNRFKINT